MKQAGLFDVEKRRLKLVAARGLKASGGQIVDATFVEAPRQRNTREDNDTIKRGEP